jgi:predicted pyridoxine 5'-phosphate oxidase superfamily flavin-nucleotide-binding protein
VTREKDRSVELNGGVAKTFDVITDDLTAWMRAQPVFFVATAPLDGGGHVNCSPKGNRQEFDVLDEHTVAFLDQTGSGVETIAHLRENGRIVLMMCAFVGPPRIVRLHGRGRVITRDDPGFAALAQPFPGAHGVGARSVVVIEVERISDSCGYGVPFMTFDEHRPTMDQWSTRKGDEGIRDYWAEKNRHSIDGLDGLDGLSVD